MISRKKIIRGLLDGHVLGAVAFAALAYLFTVVYADQRDREVALAELQSDLQLQARSRAEALSVYVQRYKLDTLFLSATPAVAGIQRAIDNGGVDPKVQINTQTWLSSLQGTFVEYLNIHPAVRQLRFIGVADNGRELVRVERQDYDVTVVPDEALQGKAATDYFAEGVKRAQGQVAVSRISLNRERGEIEVPHVPTMRLMTPIHSPTGGVFGLVVMNIDLEWAFSLLHEKLNSSNRIYLLNMSDEFLLHPDRSRRFGFEFGNSYRWADAFQADETRPGLSFRERDDGEVIFAQFQDVDVDIDQPLRLVVAASSEHLDQMLLERYRNNRYQFAAILWLTIATAVVLSRRRRSKDTQARRNAEFAAVFAGSSDAVLSVSRNREIKSWNGAAAELFGYTEADAGMRNVRVDRRVGPPDEEGDALEYVLQGGGARRYNTVIEASDGRTTDVHVTISPLRGNHGDIFGASIICRDITAELEAKEELKSINDNLEVQVRARTAELESASVLQRAMLQSAGYAIIAAGTDTVVTLFNAAAEKILGYTAEEVVGKFMIRRFCSPEFVERERERLQNSKRDDVDLAELNDKNLERELETDFIRKDGSRVPVMMKTSMLHNDNGEPLGLLCIAIDLTERNQAQQELIEAKAIAEDASRAKSEFLANMSHEIRTPMNAVLGMLNLLGYTELNPRQLDYVSKASVSAETLLGIINDILDFSKIEAGKLQLDPHSFSLDDLLREVAVILSMNVAGKDVEILFNVDPKIPRRVIGDALRIKQILINLAGNAVKFTKEGEVMLSVFVQHAKEDQLILGFTVRDTGIGMTPEHMQRLFSSFSQAEAGITRRFGGTGLGLVICQNLIKMMGGELEVDSELGKGSTFSFSLALDRAEDEQALLATARPPIPNHESVRLLVIDDNANARQIVVEICESLGWRCEARASGAEGVQAIEQAEQSYDLVFVDWMMPEMNGWETAMAVRALAEKGVDVPKLVMVTAHAKEVYEQSQSEEFALDGFLMKPLTGSDIYNVVAETLSGVPRATPHQPAQVSQQQLSGMRILLVEDNVTNQQVARELLGLEGAEVSLAENGQEALDALSHGGLLFDVVLMDLQMPVMDGLTATRKIRGELGLRYLPIIAMTANAMPADRQACLDAGMNDHIGKPFDVRELILALLKATGRDAEQALADAPVLTPPSTSLPPSPEGFGFKEAVVRMGNNSALYAGQARNFAARSKETVFALEQIFKTGNQPLLVRELHTVRGVASTLGANALGAAIFELENGAKAGLELPVLTVMLDDVKHHMARAAEVFIELADALEAGKADVPEVEHGSEGVDTEALYVKLQELMGELADSNMRAIDTFEALRAELMQVDVSATKTVAEAVANLDFSSAGDALKNIMNGMAQHQS
ncbi:response regulator [Spongiibacter sp. KMU-166]|uniref:histidine kinase n=1 Tax=Spongiibacter thalassae TaxID=2721624 RepID=A0ABX1GM15_9GAMM|nr:response regulator [Spongiibacter thalassae]NKI19428.1 response regulator [Spongiibacter thalassae]